MEPMYECAHMENPWDWWSIQNKNAEKTQAVIKQYTRWGVGDIYFLARHYGRLEMITCEIKTFKAGGAKLSTGRELELDYCVKVLGFLSDFGTDKLMQCERMLGPFPEGDTRRWVLSDQSEIDANRFGSLGLSCGAASFVRQSLWYHEHPMDAKILLDSGTLTWNYAEPELGLTAYHYHPRKGTSNMIMVGKYAPVLDGFHIENDIFRVALYREQCSPKKWWEGCNEDWNKYCEMFEKNGGTPEGKQIPRPPYPYSIELLESVIDAGTEVEQYYLDYLCHKTFGKESLGYVAECETQLR